MSSNTIGALNYRVGANVSGFVEGMTLSRSEMRMTKREMLASRTDAEKLQDKLNVLEKAYKSGAIELDQYHRTMVRLKSETAEAKEARAQQAADMQKAAQLTERLKTEEERLAEQREELIRLKPHLSEQAYARALDEVNARTPDAIAAADRLERTRRRQQRREELLNREMAEGRNVTRSVETATERYGREVAQLDKQLRRGAINQETYRRAVERSRKELDASRRAARAKLPVIGNLTSSLSAMTPATIALTVAGAGLTAGFYAGSRAARAFGEEAVRQLEEVDRTAKMARRLGMMPENLVALQLATREYAGDSVNLEMSLQRMTRRFAEAAAGGGEAKDAIKQLGLNAKELSGQDPAIIFQRVAEAMQRVENSGDRVRLAMKLFDSEGVGLVTVLAEGGDVLDRYLQLAQTKGLLFTDEEAARLESANDAIGRLTMTFEGAARRFAVEYSPHIKNFADMVQSAFNLSAEATRRFSGYLTPAIQAFSALQHGPMGLLLSKFTQGQINGALDALSLDTSAPANTEQKNLERDTAAAIANQQSGATRLNDAVKTRLDTLRKQNRELAIGAERVALIEARQAGATADQLRAMRYMQVVNQRMRERIRLQKDAERQREAEERARQQRADQIRNEGQQLTDSLRTPLEVLRANLQDYNRLLRAGAIDHRTANRARAAALRGFASSADSNDQRLAPSLQHGSDEAYRAIVQAMQNTPDQRLAAMQEQIELAQIQADASVRMVELLEDMEAATGV